MANLLKETISKLEANGKDFFRDVSFISCKLPRSAAERWTEPAPDLVEIPIKDFVKLANVEYDDGYGSPEVNMRLLIVGEDWWMERHEYDGSEWWEFKTMPTRPKTVLAVCPFYKDPYEEE